MKFIYTWSEFFLFMPLKTVHSGFCVDLDTSKTFKYRFGVVQVWFSLRCNLVGTTYVCCDTHHHLHYNSYGC